MSNPIPAHLAPEVEEYMRYGEYGIENETKIRLFADLLVANAVPYNLQAEVARAIDDGWLSPAGDILRYDAD